MSSLLEAMIMNSRSLPMYIQGELCICCHTIVASAVRASGIDRQKSNVVETNRHHLIFMRLISHTSIHYSHGSRSKDVAPSPV